MIRRIFASIFAEPSKPNPVFAYGFLVVILLLLVERIWWFISLPPQYPYERYTGFVVVLMLLFNHLAYQFRLPTRLTVFCRILAIVWLAFGLFYIFRAH
jgi:hypothetical protein